MSEVANKIVNSILIDISDRCGFGNAWEQIDDDIQDDIREEWIDIINNNLRIAKKKEPETDSSEKVLKDIFSAQKTLIALQVINIGTGLRSNWTETESVRLLDQVQDVVNDFNEALEENE